MQQQRLGTHDAARFLGISARTAEKWRLTGEGPPFLKIGRRVLYDLGDLEEYLASCRRRSTSDPGPVEAAAANG